MEGNAFLEGITLAEKEINERGGVNGVPLKVLIEDTSYDAKQSLTIAKKFSSLDASLSGVIISTLHEVKVSAPIFENKEIPSVVLWDATPEIEKMGKGVFAIGPWAPDTGEKSSRFSFKTLGKKSVSIINNQHDWGISIAESFKKDFTARGGVVLSHDAINPDVTDYRPFLTKIKLKKPEVIYAPITYNLTNFAKQVRQLGIRSEIVMSDNVTEAVLQEEGAAFEGIYHSSVADPSNAKVEELRKSYIRNFKKEPTLILFNA